METLLPSHSVHASLTSQSSTADVESKRIQQRSRGLLDVNQGSVYPALQRLEQRGWIRSAWGTTENNRQAKYYRLTKSGERALGAETENWLLYAGAVEWILEAR